jgi:hypothetical protein
LSALDGLSAFEAAVLDGLPTGKAASELLDRLKGVESLIAEIKAHYKERSHVIHPLFPAGSCSQAQSGDRSPIPWKPIVG